MVFGDEIAQQASKTENMNIDELRFNQRILNRFDIMINYIVVNPWIACILTFLANGLLGLGMLKFPAKSLLNNDIDDLYVPKNSPTQENINLLLQLFPDTSGHEFYAHQSVKKPLFGEVLLWRHDRGNILQSRSYDEINHIIKYVNNISTFTVNSGYAKYPEVCARRNNACVINGLEIVKLLKNNTQGEIPLDQLYNKGGQHYDDSLNNLALYKIENGVLKNATYIKLKFYLRQDSEDIYQNSKLWQDHFITYMKKFIKNQYPEHLHIVFQTADSFYEELGNDTFMDIPYFSLVFTVLLTFTGFVFSGGDAISKRVNISRMGVLVTPMSVLGAWGLLMACEVEFTNIIGCMPLYIQCHQIFNSHITLSHISDVNGVDDAKKRVMYAVKKVVVPITITTIVHVISFAVGIASDYYVVKLVCIYFVVTMLFNYINHFIFFTATLTLHEHRIDAKLHFCCCNRLTSREELQESGRNCCVIGCCSGKKPETREDTEGKIERMSRTITSWLVLTWPAKLFTALGFMVYVSFVAYGISRYNIDAIHLNEVSQKSYFDNWHRAHSANFNNEITIQFTTLHQDGFLNDSIAVYKYFNLIKSKSYIQDKHIHFWYDTLKNKSSMTISSEVDLINKVRSKLFSKQSVFENDLVIDISNRSILASRFYMQTINIHSTADMINILQNLDTTVNDIYRYKSPEINFTHDGEDSFYSFTVKRKYKHNVVVHSPSFQLIDSHMQPQIEILKITITQLVVLIIGFLVVKINVLLVVFIGLSYMSMVAGMFGLSFFCGIYLSQIPMIFYMMATWYFVNTLVHILFSYIKTEGTDRGARINVVMNSVSYIIFLTLFGHLLGILILVFAISYVFTTAFVIYTLMLMISIIHTLYFFPVFLSFFGIGETNLSVESIKTLHLESTCSKGKTNANFLPDDYLMEFKTTPIKY